MGLYLTFNSDVMWLRTNEKLVVFNDAGATKINGLACHWEGVLRKLMFHISSIKISTHLLRYLRTADF